jgi:hypothetical protein
MAYTREDCRELSRIIRDDLIHLGLVDSDRSAPLAAGARASAGDLIVARENDHQLFTDPGHTLANGDRFVIHAVTGEGLFVRRVLEDEQLAERPVLYPAAKAHHDRSRLRGHRPHRARGHRDLRRGRIPRR